MKPTIGTAVLVIATAATLMGCDSVQGIPGESSTAATTGYAAPTTTEASPAPAPPPTVTVGAVPGNPAAAPALQAWAADLASGDPAALSAKCWTIAPQNTAAMYANKDAILQAIAQPGVDGQFAVLWKSASTTVSIKRSEIRSGYACPRVYPNGTVRTLNDADARHTVRRYLSRLAGAPVSPADTEGAYPLLCTAQARAWDPQGTGRPIAAPLANNPGKLTGTTGFRQNEMVSRPLRADYIAVDVPVTNSSGLTQRRTFTLTIGAEGYCIGDVSA